MAINEMTTGGKVQVKETDYELKDYEKAIKSDVDTVSVLNM